MTGPAEAGANVPGTIGSTAGTRPPPDPRPGNGIGCNRRSGTGTGGRRSGTGTGRRKGTGHISGIGCAGHTGTTARETAA